MNTRESSARNVKRFTCLLSVLAFAVTLAEAAGPGVITYQGRVKAAGGVVPGDGLYSARFSLWNTESNGVVAENRLWQETHLNTVTVSRGVFSVALGSATPFPDGFFPANPLLWLEVEVDLDGNGFDPTEIYSPRTAFTAAPYAFSSDHALRASSAVSALKNVVHDFMVETGESVSAGDVVLLLETGKIRKGSGTLASSKTIFTSGEADDITATALTESDILIAYRDHATQYGTILVAHLEGLGLELGPPTVFHLGLTTCISVVALSPDKFAVAFVDNSNLASTGAALVGSVSGRTVNLSQSSKVEFTSGPISGGPGIVMIPMSASQVVILYLDNSNPLRHWRAIVGAISGSSISFPGSAALLDSPVETSGLAAAPLSSSRFVTAYDEQGKIRIGDVSGSSITFLGATGVPIKAGGGLDNLGAASLSADKFVIGYRDHSDGDKVYAVIGTPVFTSLVLGSPYLASENMAHVAVMSPSQSESFTLAFCKTGSPFSPGAILECSVDGLDVDSTTSAPLPLDASVHDDLTIIGSGAHRVTVLFGDYSQPGAAYALPLPGYPGLTGGIPLGICAGTGGEGQIVPVVLHGVSDTHSGLLPGKWYYANPDGSLTYGLTPVRVGPAVSTTEILLDIAR